MAAHEVTGARDALPAARGPYSRTMLFCAVAVVVDGLLTGVPSVSMFLGVPAGIGHLAAGFYRLIRRDNARARQAVLKSLLMIVLFFAMFGATLFNRQVGRENAARIIRAVETYQTDKGVYPSSLEALCPEYLPRVPRCAWRCLYADFTYCAESSGQHRLWWISNPPYGRRSYLFETREWKYLD